MKIIKVTLTIVCDDSFLETKEFKDIKNSVLSGEMQRDMKGGSSDIASCKATLSVTDKNKN